MGQVIIDKSALLRLAFPNPLLVSSPLPESFTPHSLVWPESLPKLPMYGVLAFSVLIEGNKISQIWGTKAFFANVGLFVGNS